MVLRLRVVALRVLVWYEIVLVLHWLGVLDSVVVLRGIGWYVHGLVQVVERGRGTDHGPVVGWRGWLARQGGRERRVEGGSGCGRGRRVVPSVLIMCDRDCRRPLQCG